MRAALPRRWRSPTRLLVLACAASGLFACESQEEYRLGVGEDVFDRKCGRCHGSSRGEGPQWVEGFGAVAPDLRQLWRRHGSPLPREELAEFIDGRRAVDAHGPRAMPVWGETLYDNLPDNATVEEMRAGTIELLLDYLETVQTNQPK